jgi:hypothetical protein
MGLLDTDHITPSPRGEDTMGKVLELKGGP